MGIAKHNKYLRKEARKAIEHLGLEFQKEIKPRPKFFPRFAWRWMLGMVLKQPEFYNKQLEDKK